MSSGGGSNGFDTSPGGEQGWEDLLVGDSKRRYEFQSWSLRWGGGDVADIEEGGKISLKAARAPSTRWHFTHRTCLSSRQLRRCTLNSTSLVFFFKKKTSLIFFLENNIFIEKKCEWFNYERGLERVCEEEVCEAWEAIKRRRRTWAEAILYKSLKKLMIFLFDYL